VLVILVDELNLWNKADIAPNPRTFSTLCAVITQLSRGLISKPCAGVIRHQDENWMTRSQSGFQTIISKACHALVLRQI
jgi:hypothetical protein